MRTQCCHVLTKHQHQRKSWDLNGNENTVSFCREHSLQASILKTCLFLVYKRSADPPPLWTRLPASSTYRNTKTPSETIRQPLHLHSLSLTKPTRNCWREKSCVELKCSTDYMGAGGVGPSCFWLTEEPSSERLQQRRQADYGVRIWSHFTCRLSTCQTGPSHLL